MSTPQSGPPDPPGQSTDTGEFRSQQGFVLGWVAVVEQIMERLRQFYAPEIWVNGVHGPRAQVQWVRGNVPGAPVLTTAPAAVQPNYFIGEQNDAINNVPQMLLFERAPNSITAGPTPRVGYHPTGYKQISNAIYTIKTTITGFDDDDAQELFNYVIAATYVETHGSNQGSCWDNLRYLPKKVVTEPTTMIVDLKVGVPVFLPPLTPVCVQTVNQRTEICLPK